MCAITTFGLLRATARPILPVLPVGRPFVSFLNVLPPSVVLKMPPLAPPLSSFHGRALALPEADVDRVRVGRIHARFDRAGPFVVRRQVVRQLRPGLAAVDRLEEAAVAALL